MSADNWARCPKCKSDDAREAIRMNAEAADSYGKVAPEEFLARLKAAQEYASETPEETLREDYEIYVDEDGEFLISYCAMCEKCGFKFSFNHKEQVPLDK